jgi:hypothetical protein
MAVECRTKTGPALQIQAIANIEEVSFEIRDAIRKPDDTPLALNLA